jgi:acyl-CoA thioester hydrolase
MSEHRRMSFSHDIRVRYGEVDMQGVVFNAHYLAYVDDCVDTWLRTLDAQFERFGWDIMLKKATVEWTRGATLGEVLTLTPTVSRWGNTSFDVSVRGTADGDPVFDATIVYVGVKWKTREPMAPPMEVKALLGRA